MLKNSDAEHHKSFNVLPGYAVMHFFIVFSGFVFPGPPMPDWGDQGSTKSRSSFTRSGSTGEKWGAGFEKAAHKKFIAVDSSRMSGYPDHWYRLLAVGISWKNPPQLETARLSIHPVIAFH